MKCLSLMQPWATLVILGVKRCETRRWQTAYRGPLAIHASRRFTEAARQLCLTEPFRSALRHGGCKHSADLPRGLILGTVDLIDCRPAADVRAELDDGAAELAFGDFSAGRWAWQLAGALALAVPRPCSGRLGLFDAPGLEGALCLRT